MPNIAATMWLRDSRSRAVPAWRRNCDVTVNDDVSGSSMRALGSPQATNPPDAEAIGAIGCLVRHAPTTACRRAASSNGSLQAHWCVTNVAPDRSGCQTTIIVVSGYTCHSRERRASRCARLICVPIKNQGTRADPGACAGRARREDPAHRISGWAPCAAAGVYACPTDFGKAGRRSSASRIRRG